MNGLLILFILCLSSFLLWLRHNIRKQRIAYIDCYFFHKGIKKKLLQQHPHLSDEQLNLVFQALREYFHLCFLAKKKMVAMPSQVVDDAWHQFILSTRFYARFCQKGLGRFLHHTPTEAMSSPTMAQQSIKRIWRLACAKENINPKNPEKLPLLFAIDDMLNIKEGFIYHLNCLDANNSSREGYCTSHIGCTSGCSGSSGGCSSCSSDSDSGGSDCGGGGCGGGD